MSEKSIFLQHSRALTPIGMGNTNYACFPWSLYSPDAVSLTHDFTPQTNEQGTSESLMITASQWVNDMATFTQEYFASVKKADIDAMFTNYIGFSIYYTTSAVVKKQVGASFGANVIESMGFKIFTATVNPLIEQVVESYTDMQWNNAKYLYYSTRCWFEIEYEVDCNNLENPYTQSLEQAAAFGELFSLDLVQYVEDVSENIAELSAQKMVYSGILSATATDVRNTFYEETGLSPYTKGYFFKKWISPYFKDWIKAELHEQVVEVKKTIDETLEQGYAFLEKRLNFVSEFSQDAASNNEALNVGDILSPINETQDLFFEIGQSFAFSSMQCPSPTFYYIPLMLSPVVKVEESIE